MLAKQFHDEAVATAEKSRLTDIITDNIAGDDDCRSTIPPLVARLLLNGWITDKGKVFLDSLAPEDCLTFLIDGKNYIHPEGLELFPFEVIETTTLHGGEAIFSHHYKPESTKDSYHQYRIFSAVINPHESKSIILGLFGPSHRMGNIDEDGEFVRLVSLFRETYAAIKKDLPALGQSLKRTEGTVMVDRSSGRVIALNQAASQIFKRSDRTIVDIGLDQLKYYIAPLLTDYNLKMENISGGNQDLSIVTLHRNCGEKNCQENIMGHLSGQFSTFAANISELSKGLGDAANRSTGEEDGHPAKKIQSEVERFSLVAKQFAFLVSYDSSEYTTQNIMVELDRAVCEFDSDIATRNRENDPQVQVVAPDGAYYMLFESVLRNHVGQHDETGASSVSVEAVDPVLIRISFETPIRVTPESGIEDNSRGLFTKHLAAELGVKVFKNLSLENDRVITELILKK